MRTARSRNSGGCFVPDGGNGLIKGYFYPILLGSSATLGRRLNKAGETRLPGFEAHHIVAENNPDAAAAQEVLARYGIDINGAENGVFLPATAATANPNGAVIHRGDTLADEYIRYVNDQLSDAASRDEALKILAQIKGDLLAGNKPWEDTGGGDAGAAAGGEL